MPQRANPANKGAATAWVLNERRRLDLLSPAAGHNIANQSSKAMKQMFVLSGALLQRHQYGVAVPHRCRRRQLAADSGEHHSSLPIREAFSSCSARCSEQRNLLPAL